MGRKEDCWEPLTLIFSTVENEWVVGLWSGGSGSSFDSGLRRWWCLQHKEIFYLYSLHTQHIMWYSLVKSKEAGDLLFVCQGWTMLGAHYELFILSSHLLHPNFLTSLLASILETPDLEITRLAPNFKRTDNFSQFQTSCPLLTSFPLKSANYSVSKNFPAIVCFDVCWTKTKKKEEKPWWLNYDNNVGMLGQNCILVAGRQEWQHQTPLSLSHDK